MRNETGVEPPVTRRRGLRMMCACAGGWLLGGGALAQGLMDPVVRSAAPGGSGNAGGPRDPWEQEQRHVSKARSMAQDVSGSLETLTRAVSQAFDTVEKLEQRLRELQADLAKYKRIKDDLLEEYRQGLFCSGCGQTKSQILAKGEVFPHSGQTIVRPTPQQIENKERELQRPIDETLRKIQQTEKELKEARDKADLGLEQVRYGVALFGSAIGYWNGALRRGEAEVHAKFKREREEMEAKLAEADRLKRLAKTREQVETLDSEARSWRRLLEVTERQAGEMGARMNRANADFLELRNTHRSRINDYVSRKHINGKVAGTTGTPIGPETNTIASGYHYLMGRIPSSGGVVTPNETNARVTGFIADYRAAGLILYFMLGHAGGAAGGPLTQPVTAPAGTPPPPPGSGNKLLDRLP